MINRKSLREQVYDFLRDKLTQGKLTQGAALNLNAISTELGISRTPLRDALLQLDQEGFVTIVPRCGVFVKRLSLEDIRHYYRILGALESTVVLSVFDRILPSHIERMKRLNLDQKESIHKEDFQAYYQQNLQFHGVFLQLSTNEPLKRIIEPMKQRLYDFPRHRYVTEWELSNCAEHDRLIAAFETGDRYGAVRLLRDVHWSFEVQKKHICRYYSAECRKNSLQTESDMQK